jgi:zona occludens toxin
VINKRAEFHRVWLKRNYGTLWAETHRHRGIDLVLMCQQYGQVTLGVNRLVEATTKFRRLDRFGLKNRYQASVRGNPEELDVIRMFSGKYEPKLYAYYSSYALATVRETARGGSMLKSPTVLVGGLGLVVAIAWFAFGGWLSGAKPPHAAVVSTLTPPPPLPVATESQPVVPAPPVSVPAIHPVRIQGGLLTEVQGVPQWLYVSESGRIMTDEEIAILSGGIVNARMDRGIRILYGSGVVWGGAAVPSSEAVSSAGSVMPVPSVTKREMQERIPVDEAPPVPAGHGAKDLLASPPGLLTSPPGLLATPPGL